MSNPPRAFRTLRGLGRAAQAALHGELRTSPARHPLGGVTVVVLVRRIAASFLG
jgi:hypothetical protein